MLAQVAILEIQEWAEGSQLVMPFPDPTIKHRTKRDKSIREFKTFNKSSVGLLGKAHGIAT